MRSYYNVMETHDKNLIIYLLSTVKMLLKFQVCVAQ